MIDRNISIHLQDFPNVSFIKSDIDLEGDMDLVRDICSTALAIRDQKNLRVRLPLQSLIVVGKDAQRILRFKDIIADEVNVKDVTINEDIAALADFKLQVNFKKVGAKYSAKMKDILRDVKAGNWQKTADNNITISGIELLPDEFELKIIPKDFDDSKFAFEALSSNDYLIKLDIEVSKDLESEGIARDIVRAIQQNRKEADLNISDNIILTIASNDSELLAVVEQFKDYISSQVLATEITITSAEVTDEIIFENKIDDKELVIGIKVLDLAAES